MMNSSKKNKKNDKEPVIIGYIKQRVNIKNKNFLMLFVGPTGSGKSYSALKLAELLDDTFGIDRCCFKAKDFMNCINDLVARTEKGEEIKGKVVMWDEFGVEHNAREFMTISNRVINYFFQTSRHLNLIVIMTVPLLSFIDSATRKLSHAIAEMGSINSMSKTAEIKLKMLQANAITGKEYAKYLRFSKNNKTFVIKRLRLHLPSKKLLEEYELKKKAFTKQLNQEIMNRLLKNEAKDNKPVHVLKPLTPMQQKILHCLKNGITKQRDIAKELGEFTSKISFNIGYMRKKGVYIGKYGELEENKDNSPNERPVKHNFPPFGRNKNLKA